MLLLAIEHSSDSAGLALFKDGLIAGQRVWDAAESRSTGLFIHLRALLAETGLSLSDVAHYTVDVGPGSYGGLRSSLAAALAFAMPSDTPVYAVTAPEIIAFGAMRELRANHVQVVGDARRGQLWTCAYAPEGKLPALSEKLALVPATGFCPAPDALVVSPDWHRLAGILEPAEASGIRLVKKRILPSAALLGELVLRRLELNVPGEPLRPVYLHEAVAGPKEGNVQHSTLNAEQRPVPLQADPLPNSGRQLKAESPELNNMPTVFDPFKIKNIVLPSRIVRSATAERIAMRDERDGEILGQIYSELAGGGVGLIISGHIAVHPAGRLHASMPMIYGSINAAPWRAAMALAHKAGGTVFFQLNHGGGRCRVENGCDPVCVSYLPDRAHDAMLGRELTGKDIGALISAYADAARKARNLGADGIQIHAAHGYLVSQFLSPLTNRRSDEWGGPLEGRANFLRTVLRTVRSALGADCPLGVKLGACDEDPCGLKIEETLLLAQWLEADGIDFIEISGAFRADIAMRKVGPGKNEGYYLPFAAQFKSILKIPVIAVGGLRSLEIINGAISGGQCDAVAMSRALICQPNLPQILRSGGKSECRGCNLCLLRHDRQTGCHARQRK